MSPKMEASSNIGQKGAEHTHTHTTTTHTHARKHLVKCDDQFVKMGASQQYVTQDGCI